MTTTLDRRAQPPTAPGLLSREPQRSFASRGATWTGQADLAILGTTVAVWAHPDDETYLAGGLLATLSDAGQRVVCVTATRGDAGNGLHDGGTAAARAALAELRTAELDAALDVLGIVEHRWLDYADGHCQQVDVDQAGGRLLQIFDEVRPETVVSFGPDGFSGHPDHQAVSHWTTWAVERWHPRPQLLQPVTTAHDRAAASDIDHRLRTYGWSFPASLHLDDLAVRVVLHRDQLDRKVEALRLQSSQTAELMSAVGQPRFAAWVSSESFRAA